MIFQNAGCVFVYFCSEQKNILRLQFRSSFKPAMNVFWNMRSSQLNRMQISTAQPLQHSEILLPFLFV